MVLPGALLRNSNRTALDCVLTKGAGPGQRSRVAESRVFLVVVSVDLERLGAGNLGARSRGQLDPLRSGPRRGSFWVMKRGDADLPLPLFDNDHVHAPRIEGKRQRKALSAEIGSRGRGPDVSLRLVIQGLAVGFDSDA